jgi:preprotein translocase subunit SecF
MSTGVTREEFLRRIGGKVNTLISLNEGNLNIEDDNIDIDEVNSVNNLVVNDKQVQTKRVNSAIEDDIEFKNKLTNDDELDEILNNSNLPSVVKEAYKKHKQPQLDVDFISETIGGQLTTQQIKEKYGKLMLNEGELNQKNKPINRLLNETLDKKNSLKEITLE